LISDVTGRGRLIPPIGRQRVDADHFDGGGIGDDDEQQSIRRRKQIAIHMDQHLQKGARRIVRQIDDPLAA
jgi:hypothetical protein